MFLYFASFWKNFGNIVKFLKFSNPLWQRTNVGSSKEWSLSIASKCQGHIQKLEKYEFWVKKKLLSDHQMIPFVTCLLKMWVKTTRILNSCAVSDWQTKYICYTNWRRKIKCRNFAGELLSCELAFQDSENFDHFHDIILPNLNHP